MFEDETDGALIPRLRGASGDARAAEAELCRRFAPSIRIYGRRHLKDEQSTHDLVQITLVSVLQAARAGKIRQEDRLAHFVLGTCRNVAARMRERGAHEELRAPEALPEVAVGPPELLEREAIMRCFAELEQRARHVVYLSFFEGRSAPDIAQSLATSAGNIRVLRHRAVLALRRCLDGSEP